MNGYCKALLAGSALALSTAAGAQGANQNPQSAQPPRGEQMMMGPMMEPGRSMQGGRAMGAGQMMMNDPEMMRQMTAMIEGCGRMMSRMRPMQGRASGR